MESLQSFLFVFQIVLSVFIILFVLIQKTEEDSLSGIGGGNGNAKMLSKRNLSTPISKITMILFVLFMFNSLLLATMSARNFSKTDSIVEKISQEENKNN